MRLVANVPANAGGIVRMMIYVTGKQGVCLFGFDQAADGGCCFDSWLKTLADAQEAAFDGYQVAPTAWTPIADPGPHCQHDWIQPVRIKGRDTGQPDWRVMERLVGTEWQEFDPKQPQPSK